MKVLRFILQKEFRQIFRDKTIIAMMFAMPTIQLIILPLAADFEVKHINVAYVDHDHSTYSQKLIHKIGSSGYFKIIAEPASYKEGLTSIEKGDADLLLEIPPDFERNLVREGSQKLNLSVDAINGTKSSIGASYLLSVITDFNQNLDINFKSPDSRPGLPAAKIEVTGTNWYNIRAEYKYYMVPGILVLLLTMMGLKGDTSKISMVPSSFSLTTATEVSAVLTIIKINAITPGIKLSEPFCSSLYSCLISGMMR